MHSRMCVLVCMSPLCESVERAAVPAEEESTRQPPMLVSWKDCSRLMSSGVRRERRALSLVCVVVVIVQH